MSTAGQKEVLGAVEIVVGEVINYYTDGTGGNWLVQMGIETMVAGGLQELANLLAPSPMPAAQNGIVRSTVAAQQRIYGQVKTGGIIAFSDSFGTNNQYLCVGVTHTLTRANGSAGMPIQGTQGFYVQDIFIPVNTGSGGWNSSDGSITSSGIGQPYDPLAGNLWIFFHDGSQTAVDSTLNTNFSYWPSTAIGKGVCYSVFKMFNSSDQATFQAAYPQGIPSMLGVVLAGSKIYDPRLDSTNGGSGSQRLATPSTWTFSSNPALIAADYLTTPKSDGGCGYATAQINWASIAAAANICDTNVNLPIYGATWNGSSWSTTAAQAQYTCNVALDLSGNCDQNLRIILDCMAGVCVVAGNQISIYAGATTASSGSFDETFLAGPVTLTTETPRQSRWNACKSTYGQDPQCDYQQQEGATVYNSTYETQDGARLLKSITLPGVNNQFAAQYLQVIENQRSRNYQQITARCNLKMLQYQCWDVLSVTLAGYGLSSAPFRIINYTLNSDLSIDVTMQAEASGTYTVAVNGQFTAFNIPSFITSGSAASPAPPAPTSLTVSALPQGVLLNWTPPSPNLYVFEEVWRAPDVSGSPGTYALLNKVVGDSYIDKGATAGTKYWYKVRAVNYWLVKSAYCTAVSTTSITNTVGGQDPGAVALGSVTGDQRNEVADSDFKFGWTYWFHAAQGPAAQQWGMGVGWDGSDNALSITGNGSAFTDDWVNTTPFNVAAGQTFAVSAELNGTANITAGNIRVGIEDATGVTHFADFLITSVTGDGRKLLGTVTIPATYTQAQLTVFSNYASAGTIITNGAKFSIRHIQIEIGSVMTAYHSTDDALGHGIQVGSGPQSVADMFFNWTSTVNSITITPSSNRWYDASQVLQGWANGTYYPGPNTVTGLGASTTYDTYPYVDLTGVTVPLVGQGGTGILAYSTGGGGTPGIMFLPGTGIAAVAQQTQHNHVPLASGGVPMTTTAAGGGGGSGGGYKCLHPMMEITRRRTPESEPETIRAGELRHGDMLLTPRGWQPIMRLVRKQKNDWRLVKLETGEVSMVTITHKFIDGGGEPIEARALTIGKILRIDGGLAAVEKLEALDDDLECVALAVPCRRFYARAGGAEHVNGTQKP